MMSVLNCVSFTYWSFSPWLLSMFPCPFCSFKWSWTRHSFKSYSGSAISKGTHLYSKEPNICLHPTLNWGLPHCRHSLPTEVWKKLFTPHIQTTEKQSFICQPILTLQRHILIFLILTHLEQLPGWKESKALFSNSNIDISFPELLPHFIMLMCVWYIDGKLPERGGGLL